MTLFLRRVVQRLFVIYVMKNGQFVISLDFPLLYILVLVLRVTHLSRNSVTISNIVSALE